MLNELKIGFWMFSTTYHGVVCDDKDYLMQYLAGDLKFKLEDYDNPPYCRKTGDEEDNDIEVVVVCPKYTDYYDFYKNDFLESYMMYYKANPLIFEVKQCLVEFYSEIERVMEYMPQTLHEKYKQIVHQLRLGVGKIVIYRGIAMKEILYQLHKANRKVEEPETLDELITYSSEALSLYNNIINKWDIVQKI